MFPPVMLPDGLDYDHPQLYVSEIGEPWRLFAKRIRGGSVSPAGTLILGISQSDNFLVDDEKLLAAAAKFGSTLGSSSNVRRRDIAPEIDFCLVGDDGYLWRAIGGIPLKAKTPIPIIASRQVRNVIAGNQSYSLYIMPILDSSTTTVGTITVPMNTSLDSQIQFKAARFSMILAGFSWIVLIIIFVSHRPRARRLIYTH